MSDGPATYLAPGKAEELAARCQADDEDGWQYKAEHGPKWSRVAVYDPEGHKLGYL